MNLLRRSRSFGGWVEFYSHPSRVCAVEMRFGIYRPPQAESGAVPILYYLAGLESTEETFLVKAGAQAFAAQHGILLCAPDTSPRGAGVPGEDESWDLGTGAGFYVDATVAPWSGHYRMFSYVSDELPALVREHFPVDPARESVFGHSMGGHGALVLALRQPGRYRSVSAFAPIAAPSRCPWGKKAFQHYLGDDRAEWARYDASELVGRGNATPPLLVDQGLDDPFLEEQLLPGMLEAACRRVGQTLLLRRHPGYDHSYHFVATFMRDHLDHHAKALA
jgi:S-formylglutathione hydrolase